LRHAAVEISVTLDPNQRRQIQTLIRGAVPCVREVLLFGSQARGDAHADSDVDLLLLVPNGEDRLATAIAARRSLWGLGLGFDIVVLGLDEWQRLRASRGYFDRQMTQEAVPLDDVA